MIDIVSFPGKHFPYVYFKLTRCTRHKSLVMDLTGRGQFDEKFSISTIQFIIFNVFIENA